MIFELYSIWGAIKLGAILFKKKKLSVNIYAQLIRLVRICPIPVHPDLHFEDFCPYAYQVWSLHFSKNYYYIQIIVLVLTSHLTFYTRFIALILLRKLYSKCLMVEDMCYQRGICKYFWFWLEVSLRTRGFGYWKMISENDVILFIT